MDELKGKNVLIVEDEEDIREILYDDLTFFGATVECVENGSKGFDLLKTKPFDVVITDVLMANGDGMELLKNIKEKLTIKSKLFICSGCNNLIKKEVESLGVIEIFEKPFNVHKMIESIVKSFE